MTATIPRKAQPNAYHGDRVLTLFEGHLPPQEDANHLRENANLPRIESPALYESASHPRRTPATAERKGGRPET